MIIYVNIHNNSNNCSSIWASWVPVDHIQTPMGCNKEGILGAGKRILTQSLVSYRYSTLDRQRLSPGIPLFPGDLRDRQLH